MLTLRTRILLIVAAIIVLVAGISAVIYFVGKTKPKPVDGVTSNGLVEVPRNILENSNFDQNQGVISTPVVTEPARTPPTALEIEQNSVKQQAKIFTERFNTYSTDSSGQNIKEVRNLVTAAMWKRISGKIGAPAGGAFVGNTTEALTAHLDTWKPPAATVSLQTRRTIEENGATTSQNQTILISLTKASGAWLVDSYTWQK